VIYQQYLSNLIKVCVQLVTEKTLFYVLTLRPTSRTGKSTAERCPPGPMWRPASAPTTPTACPHQDGPSERPSPPPDTDKDGTWPGASFAT
jgi:hypothetical protein